MKTIKFNDKDYQVPENWGEVTIKMVVDVDDYSQIVPDAPIISIICGYTGIPMEELKSGNVPEVQNIMSIMEFIYHEYQPEITNSFTYFGKTYSCNADIVEQKFEDWVSIQTILHNYKDAPVRGLSRMIAVLCKKESETLDSINLDERARMFDELPITDAKNIEGFFLTSLNAYNNFTRLSSVLEHQDILIQAKLTELSNIMKARKAESGISLLTKLRIGYYQIYLWYIKSLLGRYFNFTPTKRSKKTSNTIWKKLRISSLRRNKLTK